MGKGFGQITTLAAVGDVTGDGHPDLVGQAKGGLMTIFPGNGNDRPQPRLPGAQRSCARSTRSGSGSGTRPRHRARCSRRRTARSCPTSGRDSRPRSAASAARTYDWVVGPGDVDGDKVPDLIVREKATGYLWLIPGTGSGFGTRRFVAAGFGDYDLGG